MYGSGNLRGGEVGKDLGQTLCNDCFIAERHEWVDEPDIAVPDIVHVILDVLRIGGYDRAVIVVIRIRCLISLIEK